MQNFISLWVPTQIVPCGFYLKETSASIPTSCCFFKVIFDLSFTSISCCCIWRLKKLPSAKPIWSLAHMPSTILCSGLWKKHQKNVNWTCGVEGNMRSIPSNRNRLTRRLPGDSQNAVQSISIDVSRKKIMTKCKVGVVGGYIAAEFKFLIVLYKSSIFQLFCPVKTKT